MNPGRASWGVVRLAWDDASRSDLRFGTAAGRFGAQQKLRLAALSGAAAERFIVGRELLSIMLDEFATEGSVDAAADGVELTAACDRCGGEHGALRVHGVPAVVSVSYAGNMVAVAAAHLADAAAVGVDIEHEPSDGARAALPALAALFAPSPPPSTLEWTFLEAALKADGRGFAVEPARCVIESGVDSRAVRIPGRYESVPVARVPGPEGFVLSVAAIAPSSSTR